VRGCRMVRQDFLTPQLLSVFRSGRCHASDVKRG
jgi:hypothetical protein